MCARYTLRSKLNQLLDQFGAEVQEGTVWEPRYNIGIGEKRPAVLAMRLINGKRVLSRFCWPFVPSWSKEWKLPYATFNARAETVAEKKAYQVA